MQYGYGCINPCVQGHALRGFMHYNQIYYENFNCTIVGEGWNLGIKHYWDSLYSLMQHAPI